MSNADMEKKIHHLEKELYNTQQKITELRSKLVPTQVKNYELKTLTGKTKTLLDLFENQEELILIHNMGPQCAYCTLWADGFNSLTPYFESRTAFALETDIPHEELNKFSKDRGWKFQTLSSKATGLKSDLNFKNEDGSNIPGVSTFFKNDKGEIFHHTSVTFGPGDLYCSFWHMNDLLKHKVKWEPKYNK